MQTMSLSCKGGEGRDAMRRQQGRSIQATGLIKGSMLSGLSLSRVFTIQLTECIDEVHFQLPLRVKQASRISTQLDVLRLNSHSGEGRGGGPRRRTAPTSGGLLKRLGRRAPIPSRGAWRGGLWGIRTCHFLPVVSSMTRFAHARMLVVCAMY